MTGIVLKTAGREIPLRFDGQAWLDVEDEFGTLEEMYRRMREDAKPMHTNLKLVEIVSRGGARRHGGKETTAEELAKILSPASMREAATLARFAIVQGMRRKDVDDEDEDVDVVAEELKRKNAEGCSTDAP